MTMRMAVISISMVRAQPPDPGASFGVGEDERADQPLDALQRDRPLPAEILSSRLPPRQDLGMTGFGLGQTALGPRDLVFEFVADSADLVFDPLEHLGQGQLDVFGDAFRADFVNERRQGVLV